MAMEIVIKKHPKITPNRKEYIRLLLHSLVYVHYINYAFITKCTKIQYKRKKKGINHMKVCFQPFPAITHIVYSKSIGWSCKQNVYTIYTIVFIRNMFFCIWVMRVNFIITFFYIRKKKVLDSWKFSISGFRWI